MSSGRNIDRYGPLTYHVHCCSNCGIYSLLIGNRWYLYAHPHSYYRITYSCKCFFIFIFLLMLVTIVNHPQGLLKVLHSKVHRKKTAEQYPLHHPRNPEVGTEIMELCSFINFWSVAYSTSTDYITSGRTLILVLQTWTYSDIAYTLILTIVYSHCS